jgi:hypothetical protein
LTQQIRNCQLCCATLAFWTTSCMRRVDVNYVNLYVREGYQIYGVGKYPSEILLFSLFVEQSCESDSS